MTTTSGIYVSLLTQEPMFQVESMAVVQRPRYEMSSSLPRPVSRLSELKVGNIITNAKLYTCIVNHSKLLVPNLFEANVKITCPKYFYIYEHVKLVNAIKFTSRHEDKFGLTSPYLYK